MADLALSFGGDLSVDATGDLVVSEGTQEGTERVLRRLLTNPLGYIWQPSYGAGLSRYIGQPAAAARIAAIIRAQMALEPIVAQTPQPSITVTIQPDGTVTADIKYVDAETGVTVPLSLPVGG